MKLKKIAILVSMMVILTAAMTAKGKSKTKVTTDGAAVARIPAGEFIMGDDRGEPDERPAHKVELKAFWMDTTEVTYFQYERCMAVSKCNPPEKYAEVNDPNRPVVGVGWADATAYCAFAGKRLPTEAEWEKAARGTDGRTYPWGEGIDCTKANYRECGVGHTLPVGSYSGGASPYGMLDMAGNAWEWVADWYDENYYRTGVGTGVRPDAPTISPTGPASGKYRVARGGSWTRPLYGMRSADRGAFKPETRSDDIGFRCATDD